MTHPISHPPPGHTPSAGKASSAGADAGASAGAAFLALLAALGDAPPPDAGANTTVSATDAEAGDAAAGHDGGVPNPPTTAERLLPSPQRDGWLHKADLQGNARQHPGGVESGLPMLPLPQPIILGALPPVATTRGVTGTVAAGIDASGTGGSVPPRGVGRVIAAPIMGPGDGAPGDVIMQPLRPPLPTGSPVQPDVEFPTTMPAADVALTLPMGESGSVTSKPATAQPLGVAFLLPKTFGGNAPSTSQAPFSATNATPPPTPSAATARAIPAERTGKSDGVMKAGGMGTVSERKLTGDLPDATAQPLAITNATGGTTTFAQVSATSAATHPGVVATTQQIVAQAQLLRNGASAEMRLRLRPPDLGEVQVVLRRSATGDLAVQLIPATRAASEALGANLHHLRAALDPHSHNQHAEVTLGQHADNGKPADQHHAGQHQLGESDEDAQSSPLVGRRDTSNSTITSQPRQASSAIDYDA